MGSKKQYEERPKPRDDVVINFNGLEYSIPRGAYISLMTSSEDEYHSRVELRPKLKVAFSKDGLKIEDENMFERLARVLLRRELGNSDHWIHLESSSNRPTRVPVMD